MKKTIILFMILLFPLFGFSKSKDSLLVNRAIFKAKYFKPFKFSKDCDACGCSASGGSMGFSSILNTNFVGVRYIYQAYQSTDGLYSNSPWFQEDFNTIQAWARIPITKKVQVTVLAPYQSHKRETATGQQFISGLGDVTILAMYALYVTIKDSASTQNSIQIGGGLKAPTGKFEQANSGLINPSFQVGTGSWDFILASEHRIQIKKFGVSSLINYTIKTENSNNYRFGNQWSYATTAFYLIQKASFSFAPQVGLAGEIYESNYQFSQIVRKSSGTVLFGKIGLEISKERLSFGLFGFLPLQQNLASNRIDAKYRIGFNLNYSL